MRTTLVAATALTTALTALLPVHAATSASTSTSASTDRTAARVTNAEHDLYLTFNGSSEGDADLTSSGSAPVSSSVASAEGGDVVAESKGDGQVARLEPFDSSAPTRLGVIVVRPSAAGNPFTPRTRGFSFGATFNLDATSEGSQADNGNNLFQRGLYTDDAQYKIQVDDRRVSCRVAGSAGAVQVQASVDVRPGVWNRVKCTRQDRTVKLVVVEIRSDGPVSRSWSRSGAIGDLAFSAAPPLSIGGKVNRNGELVKASADQFNGRVDNVFFLQLDG